MVNFRKTLMVVALLAAFAGLAAAQATTPVINPIPQVLTTTYQTQIVRSEGVAELVPAVQFLITTKGAGAYNVTIFSSQPITSRSTEITLTVDDLAAAPIVGTISGSQVTFSGLVTTANSATITLAGLRIDATKLPSLASGASTGLGENLLVVFQATNNSTNASPFQIGGGTASPVASATNLVYAVPTLLAATSNTTNKLTGDSTVGMPSLLTCSNGTNFDPTQKPFTGRQAFYVSLAEQYSTAWKTKLEEQDTPIAKVASQGTQFSVSFTNVPANVALYVPVTVNTMSVVVPPAVSVPLVTLTLASPSSPTLSADKSLALVPAAGVVYEVTLDTASLDTVYIPVYVSYTGQPALTTSAAPVTATVQYAPQSSNAGVSDTAPIPRFLGAAQSSSNFTFTVGSCNSMILFPYITNQPGYDTGLAISNAGNLLTDGGQSGTCQWSFYGDGAPTTAVPPTGTYMTGTTNAVLLSSMAPGFTGFAVANCGFEGGLGYAFIVGNINGNEVAQGYLALLGGKTGNFGPFPID